MAWHLSPMKDNFSGHASHYARYRPTYPDQIFRFLYKQVGSYDAAWDCGTGNGQVAVKLAEQFRQVYATDLSENQLTQAPSRPNITYRVMRAEDSTFNEPVDLITVAQAIHWFDFEAFYTVVDRVLKPAGRLAVLGYPLLTVDEPVDTVIKKLYEDILGDRYWDPERKHVEARYRTIPFPLEEVEAPEFAQTLTWTLEDLLGYLNTWSAVQHYISRGGKNPVNIVADDLRNAWGASSHRQVCFPIVLRVGKKQIV